jgi:hypothetical protein
VYVLYDTTNAPCATFLSRLPSRLAGWLAGWTGGRTDGRTDGQKKRKEEKVEDFANSAHVRSFGDRSQEEEEV